MFRLRFLTLFITMVCFSLLGGVFSSSVYASEQFYTHLNSTYTITPLGNTQVEHHIAIINNTPTLYLTQFALKVNSSRLSQVTVTSNDQTLKPNIATVNQETSIGITFTDKVLGKGKQRILIIRYQDPDTSVVAGSTLGIYIPKLLSGAEFDRYDVTLKTPLQFGQPTQSVPTATQSEHQDPFLVTQFQDLKSQSIATTFGDHQLFNLSLRYNLENTTDSAGITQIALPPDTTFQRIFYSSIQPPPQKIELDDDGNWIATYTLESQQSLEVIAEANVKLTLQANPEVPVLAPRAEHVEAKQFWESNDEEVKQLAKNHDSARDIYTYIVDTLSYNAEAFDTSNLATRLGAKVILSQPQNSMCQEYTDLFVALARAKQIPSRRVVGYAYTQNSTLRPLGLVDDVLHTWPEYYREDSQLWQPIDPTWEDTTGGINYFDQFDLNHIVFAINGTSSTLPFSAGTYKTIDPVKKSVAVSFGQETPELNQPLELIVKPRTIMGFTIPGTYIVEIHNTHGAAQYATQVTFEPSAQTNVYPTQTTVETLLPFQTIQIPFSFTSDDFTHTRQGDLQLSVNGKPYFFTLTAGPPVSSLFNYSPLLIGVGISCIVFALLAGSVLVLRRKR